MESGGKVKAPASSDDDVRSAMAAAAAREEDFAPAVSSLPAAPPSGARPYYECVFCKRGFTAAQALGGHMNIHRRDRARPAGVVTSSSSVPRTTAEFYSKYRRAAYPQAPPDMPAPTSRATLYYYPGAAAAAAGGEDEEAVSPSPTELALFDADTTRDHDQGLHLSLGCYGGGDEATSERHGGEPETKLDLELRLGRVVPGID